MWQQALDIFLLNYKPAADEASSTDQFTTAQLHAMICGHTGLDFPMQELATTLQQKGYFYACTTELQFEWLFLRVDPVLSY